MFSRFTVISTKNEIRFNGYIFCDNGYNFLPEGMFYIMESDIVSDDSIAKMKFPIGRNKAKFDFNITVSDGLFDDEAELFYIFNNVCKIGDVHRFSDIFGKYYNVTPHDNDHSRDEKDSILNVINMSNNKNNTSSGVKTNNGDTVIETLSKNALIGGDSGTFTGGNSANNDENIEKKMKRFSRYE